MGLFDNLLKAVENGAIEKSLGSAVDKLESSLDQAIAKAETVAGAPERALDHAASAHARVTAAGHAVHATTNPSSPQD